MGPFSESIDTHGDTAEGVVGVKEPCGTVLQDSLHQRELSRREYFGVFAAMTVQNTNIEADLGVCRGSSKQ